ncbi:MAG: hypothetical protein KF764_25510 [Labilithrix sp.]|nr:hypothetical protein [Labilithrix sp.]
MSVVVVSVPSGELHERAARYEAQGYRVSHRIASGAQVVELRLRRGRDVVRIADFTSRFPPQMVVVGKPTDAHRWQDEDVMKAIARATRFKEDIADVSYMLMALRFISCRPAELFDPALETANDLRDELLLWRQGVVDRAEERLSDAQTSPAPNLLALDRYQLDLRDVWRRDRALRRHVIRLGHSLPLGEPSTREFLSATRGEVEYYRRLGATGPALARPFPARITRSASRDAGRGLLRAAVSDASAAERERAREQRVLDVIREHPGLSGAELEELASATKGGFGRMLKELRDSGRIVNSGTRYRPRYYIGNRV